MSVHFPKGVWPPRPERAYTTPEERASEPKRVWCLVGTYDRDDSWKSCVTGGGYRSLNFHIVSVPETNYLSLDGAHNEIDTVYYDLEIRSQGDQTEPGVLYAMELEYRGVHAIDSHRAKIMARFFDVVERKLAAIEKKEGRVPYQDYIAYVVRLCRVLGIDRLALPVSAKTEDVTGSKHAWVSTRDMTEVQRYLHTCVQQLWTERDREIAKDRQEKLAAEKEAANG